MKNPNTMTEATGRWGRAALLSTGLLALSAVAMAEPSQAAQNGH